MATNPNDPSLALNQLLGGGGSLTQSGLPTGTGTYSQPTYPYDRDIPGDSAGNIDPALLTDIETAIQEELVVANVQASPEQILQWAQLAASDPNLTSLWQQVGSAALSESSFVTYARDFIRQQYVPTIANSVTAQKYAKYGITDTVGETVYSPVRSLWEQYFGKEPSTAQLQDVIAHGADPHQWEDYIRSLPSHIQGATIGQYSDVRTTADSISQTIYGHPSNDQITADLLHHNSGSKSDVQAYYDAWQFTPGKDVSFDTYNKAYAANAPIAHALTNDYPHPLQIKQQVESLPKPGSEAG